MFRKAPVNVYSEIKERKSWFLLKVLTDQVDQNNMT